MLGGYLKIKFIKMRQAKGKQGRGQLKKSLHTEGCEQVFKTWGGAAEEKSSY